MPGNFPGTEPPTTPGPFAAGLTRNEGNIPGVGVAMPFSIPSFDPSAQGEQRPPPLASMPLGAPPLPPGPHPSLLAANQQQPYQQQNPQQIQHHQAHPQQMPQLPLPPSNLPQLQPPSHLSMMSHPHLPRNPPQLSPLGMPSSMPGPMPTSLPMPMPSQMVNNLPTVIFSISALIFISDTTIAGILGPHAWGSAWSLILFIPFEKRVNVTLPLNGGEILWLFFSGTQNPSSNESKGIVHPLLVRVTTKIVSLLVNFRETVFISENGRSSPLHMLAPPQVV